MSTQLWSDEVALANASAPLPEREPAYEFNNGRCFEQPQPLYGGA